MKLRPRRSLNKPSTEVDNGDNNVRDETLFSQLTIGEENQEEDEYRPSTTNEETNETSFDETSNLDSSRRSKGRRGAGKVLKQKRPIDDTIVESEQDETMDETKLESVEKENSLWVAVKSGKSALSSVVDDWIESYRQDREQAILELMQFFVLASGCRGKITLEMKAMGNPVIIKELAKSGKFQERPGGAYPIVMTGPSWKKFKSRFCELINKLLSQCQFSIIFDQYLTEWLIPFLIALADSQIRAFRHTSTLAALKMVTTLVDIGLTLSINIDNNLRQIQSEKAKGGKRSERLEVLENKRTELGDNMEDIKTMLKYMFRSIFVHRYKDVVPEIRALCISELGVWMKKFPNMFLDDSYMKYMGWRLYDKVGDIRLKCLQGLIPLYENEILVKRLELFTDKFKERLVEMALDKEPEVAVQAIHLLTLIHKMLKDILADQNCDQVYTLVYTVNRNVAQAAGDFVLQRLILAQDADDTTDQCSRRGKKRSKNTPYIRDLILFFMESELHEHCSYLVDSLIHHEMIKDWECMTDLLLEEPGPGEEVLDDQHESLLVDIMVSAVRQAVTGEVPVGRVVLKKSRAHANDIKMLEEEKEKVSNHFIAVLPDLLKKYKADSSKIADLITIPCYFDLSCYSQKSDELEGLLTLINEIVEIHSDPDVLEGCARVYEYLQDDNFAHYRISRISMSSLLDTLFEKYRASLEGSNKGGDGVEEMETLTFIMKKIVPLVGCCLQLDLEDIWNIFFEKWVKNARKDDSEPTICEATKCGLTICHYTLLWKLHSVSKSDARSEEDLSSTKKKLTEFISSVTNLIEHSNKKVADEAYFSLCDIFIVFGHHLANGSLALPELVCRPSKGQMDSLITYLSKNVFIEEEEESEADEALANATVEKLHNKRHILAGYCKLIIFNVVPMHYASCVLRFYLEFFNDYGDLIKALISKMKDISKVLCAKTMAFALADGFKDLLSNKSDDKSTSSEDEKARLDQLKDLAKRFCLTFGLDSQKNRDVFVALHKEGINFALQDDDGKSLPANLLFLEILAEISNKLVKPDKKAVLAYLDKSLEGNTVLKTGEQWSPLALYRKTLSESILRAQNLPLNQTPSRRQFGQKRTLEQDADDSTEPNFSQSTENDEPTHD